MIAKADEVARLARERDEWIAVVGSSDRARIAAEEELDRVIGATESRVGELQFDLADLHDSLRTVYAKVPALPITPETMDAATDALHEFCLLIGLHGVEVGHELG